MRRNRFALLFVTIAAVTDSASARASDPALDEARVYSGSEVPPFVCFVGLIGSQEVSANLTSDLELDLAEFEAVAAARDSWLASRERRSSTQVEQVQGLDALRKSDPSTDGPWAKAFIGVQHETLRAMVSDAREVFLSLSLSLDDESFELLVSNVRKCKGIHLTSAGPHDADLFAIYKAFEPALQERTR
jgi:hypothetical protein